MTPPPRLRTVPVVAAIALLVGLTPACTGEEAGGARRRAPNILLILTDNHRPAPEGMTRLAMPKTLRWFADQGTRYPFGYVTTPLCCPSRASIMTGLYGHNHRVQANIQEPPGSDNLDHGLTVQRYLRDAGYRTGLFGKFFNKWDLSLDPPHFDDWVIFNKGYEGAEYNVRGDVQVLPTYSTKVVSDNADRFIRRAHEEDPDRPWFALVAPFAPHGPSDPEPGYRDAPVGRWRGNPAVGEEDVSDKPPFVQESEPLSAATIRTRRVKQLRTLLSVDDMVDRLMRRLQRTGELRGTLAVFMGDNGIMWGEHRLGGKSVPYTASILVPMFIRWPGGGLEPGTVDRRFAANVDLAPTFLEAAGVEPGHDMDGRSLLGDDTRSRILTEHWQNPVDREIPDWASLRTRRYQYVEYYGDDGRPTFREYYDLRRDRWQLTNLLGDDDPTNDPSAATLRRLSSQLGRDRRCAGSGCP